MSWTYKYLMDDRPKHTSTYGMLCGRDRKHYVVLLSQLGQVLIRTEKFPKNEPLQTVLQTLRKCCANDACYEIKTIGSSHYFTITAPGGYILAISDQYVDLKTTQRKIRLVKELGTHAGMVYLPKIQRRQHDPESDRKKQRTKKI
jgi:hypothetical protein